MSKFWQNLTKNFSVIFLIFFVSCVESKASQIKNITIFAEQNMVEALTKISRIYSQKNGIIVSINFGTSAELIAAIEEGEPSDVFISAHKFWIDNLKQKGLVDIYNIAHIADDSLVLVTSKNNEKLPQEFEKNALDLDSALRALNQNESILIIDDEGNSLGQYSAQMLDNLGLDKIKIFPKLAEDRNSVANLLKENPQNYTILPNSLVVKSNKFHILSNPKNQHIFYQALVIAGDNMENAREFVKFLKSEQAKKIFIESGFEVN